jgi:hypothetical protein
MHTIGIWLFLGRSLFKAAVNAVGFFNLDVKTAVTTGLLLVFGFSLHWKVKGLASTKEEISTTVILTVIPFCLFFSCLFICNSILAPYRVYSEAMRVANTVFGEEVAKGAGLENQIKHLEEELSKKPAPETRQSRDSHPTAAPKPPILVGIRIAKKNSFRRPETTFWAGGRRSNGRRYRTSGLSNRL